MKNILVSLVICLVVCNAEAVSQTRKDARNNGAFGKVTLRVIDDLNNIVTNAHVNMTFEHENKGNQTFEADTDENGEATFTGTANYAAYYTITKQGYYKTWEKYKFSHAGKECAERDKLIPWKIRWIPWNPTVTVVLKKIRNPIPMKVREVKVVLPGLENYYPFDLDVGDWVEPHGEGRKAHIYIYYYNNTIDTFTGTWVLRIKTTIPSTGLHIFEYNDSSDFKTMYFAPQDNYTNIIEFFVEETKTEVVKNTKLKENQYMVFKCQNTTNPPTYNYGKIYQPLRYGKFRNSGKYEIHFRYYYNPTLDDRNLEFDPQQNIINTVDKRGNTIRFKP